LCKERESVEKKYRDDWRQLTDAERQLNASIQTLSELDAKMAEAGDVEGRLEQTRSALAEFERQEKACSARMATLKEQLQNLDVKVSDGCRGLSMTSLISARPIALARGATSRNGDAPAVAEVGGEDGQRKMDWYLAEGVTRSIR
jgi:hypothetical protein